MFDAARRQQDKERGFATAYLPPSRHADAYFGLLADLETLFERSVDLVETAMLRNPYRRREIEATQVLVHAAA